MWMKLNLPEKSGQRYKTKTSELFYLKGEEADTFMVSSGVVGWAPHMTQWERTCLPCRKLKRCGFSLWIGKSPWRRKWQPFPVLLPGKFHGQRSLMGYIAHGVAKILTQLGMHAPHRRQRRIQFSKANLLSKMLISSPQTWNAGTVDWKSVRGHWQWLVKWVEYQ